jgi:2-oxoglutarate dehydrogenase complex dehydrogenase (E1) component-like enzyme
MSAEAFPLGRRDTIPLVDDLIQPAGEKAKEVVLGMAHRGRLNVGQQGKLPADRFSNSEGKHAHDSVPVT